MRADEIEDLKRCLSEPDGQTPEEAAAFGAMADQLITEQEMRIEALEAVGVEVTLTGEHFLGAFRFAPGRYRIVKLDGPAPAPEF